MKLVKQFLKDEEGATAIEYGLLVALIALVILTMLGNTGKALNNTYSTIGKKMR